MKMFKMYAFVFGIAWRSLLAACYAGTVHYVSLDGGHVSPFTNWVHAATNIQDAVDVALDCDTVLVSNGTYSLVAEIIVTNNIVLESLAGPEESVINAASEHRSLNLLSDQCTISGFIFHREWDREPDYSPPLYGGGILSASKLNLITNCVIRYALWYEGTVSGCTVVDSIISNNYSVGLSGCVVSNCVITGNRSGGLEGCSVVDSEITHNADTGVLGGAATNCLISHNSGCHKGGGMHGGTAVNCTISDNSAELGGGVFGGIVINCLITGNYAHEDDVGYGHGLGGGMYEGSAINCTISGNGAFWYGGGMYRSEAWDSVIRNNGAREGERRT